eukprot:CFRG0111T1
MGPRATIQSFISIIVAALVYTETVDIKLSTDINCSGTLLTYELEVCNESPHEEVEYRYFKVSKSDSKYIVQVNWEADCLRGFSVIVSPDTCTNIAVPYSEHFMKIISPQVAHSETPSPLSSISATPSILSKSPSPLSSISATPSMIIRASLSSSPNTTPSRTISATSTVISPATVSPKVSPSPSPFEATASAQPASSASQTYPVPTPSTSSKRKSDSNSSSVTGTAQEAVIFAAFFSLVAYW